MVANVINNEFHIAHFCGCSTLFNSNSFEPDLEAKSLVVLRTQNCQEWAVEAVITKARFRRVPKDVKDSCTMISLHCQIEVAKRRSIALNLLMAVRTAMVEEAVDFVGGDFTGTSWRRKRDSIVEQALSDAMLPLPPGSTPLWGPGRIPNERTDVCGYLKLLCCKK